jgi:hypothetical protein
MTRDIIIIIGSKHILARNVPANTAFSAFSLCSQSHHMIFTIVPPSPCPSFLLLFHWYSPYVLS